MQFGFVMPGPVCETMLTQSFECGVTGADQMVMARRAEEIGYDMIFLPEHFSVPQTHTALMGSPDRQLALEFQCALEQAYFAGATSSIRVNAGASLLAPRHAAAMATMLAALDWMSNGRITVTFGVGWDPEEFEVLGVPLHERGRSADEYLAAVVELSTRYSSHINGSPHINGERVPGEDVALGPSPPQRAQLPIWIGGDAEPALRRAARYADGWFPWLTRPDDIPAKLDFIKSQPTYDGRRIDVFYGLDSPRVGDEHGGVDDPAHLLGMTAAEMVDRLGRFAQLGVTMTAPPIPPVKNANAYLDYAQWMIEDIKPKVG
ncbi:LLM class flavin-dependent oxidoreductase [Mycobacterium sp.]|uniref:LLM class flavin-dependent oxidoreductase n=1 Tax=Mycobacterium sp. TaxID=1785 RepID=UPI0031D84E4D